MNLNQAMFRQELARHMDALKQLCQEWGVPQLATCVTLLLRDPENDNMSFLLTDDADLEGMYRVLRHLQREGL